MALAISHITYANALALRADASARYPLFAALTTALLLVIALILAPDAHTAMIREHGPVESLSAVLFFGAALVLLAAGTRVWPFTTLAFTCGLRELDLDKSLFTEGLLKSRQYIGDSVSWGERLVALALLTALLTAGVLALRRGLQNARSRIRNSDGVILCVTAGLILGVLAKSLDGLTRKIAPFGVEPSDATARTAGLLEEIGEFGMALFFFCAAIAFTRGVKSLHRKGGA